MLYPVIPRHCGDRLREVASQTRVGRIVSLALATAALFPVGIWAQAANVNDTMLTRLTAEAIAASPSLEQSRALARAAASRVRPAGALPDPTVAAGVMNLTLPRFAFREHEMTQVTVELSQELPWPGTLGARTAAARARARGSQAELAARRREVIVQTAELYYRLRYVVTARATLQRQRDLLAAGVEISTARYATTTAPQSDPLQARVALARLDTEAADLVAQETELRAQLRALRNVSGLDSLSIESIRPEQVPSDVHLSSAIPTEKSADSLGPDSLPHHPRLRARQAEMESAEQMVRVEQLGARPDFTFMTQYGARPLGSDFFSAFVGVRIPLYAGRKQHRLADAARAEADAARAALAEERAALTEEIRTTVALIRSEAVRLRLLTGQVVPASQATVDATLRSYRVGQIEFLTVLAAEDALYRARLDAARVAADHLTHLVMLEQLVTPEEDS
jgi:cobalt-zinc-cadmium efflux system outer membrane protein